MLSQAQGIPSGMGITALLSILKSALSRELSLLHWAWYLRWAELEWKGLQRLYCKGEGLLLQWWVSLSVLPCTLHTCGQGHRDGWAVQVGSSVPYYSTAPGILQAAVVWKHARKGDVKVLFILLHLSVWDWRGEKKLLWQNVRKAWWPQSWEHSHKSSDTKRFFGKVEATKYTWHWVRLISVLSRCLKINLVPSDWSVFFRGSVTALESFVCLLNNFWKDWQYLFCIWESELWFYIKYFENLTATTRNFHDGDLPPSITVVIVYHNW